MTDLLKYTQVIIIVLFVTVLCLNTGRSQTAVDLINQADSLHELKNYDSAIVLGERALELALSEFGTEDTVVARVLAGLGKYYGYINDFNKAESLTTQALEIRKKFFGENDVRTAQSMYNLAIIYNLQGRHVESESLHRKTLAIRRGILGDNNIDVSDSYFYLGLVCRNRGKLSEAETCFYKSSVIRENILGPMDVSLVRNLNELAVVYDRQARYRDAEIITRRCLDICEKEYGVEHRNTVMMINNLGRSYFEQSDYTNSIKYFEKALAIKKKLYDADDPSLVTTLANLAETNVRLNNFHEAEKYYKKTIDILIKAYGHEYPPAAMCMGYLGSVYQRLSEFEKAEKCYMEAIAVIEKKLGEDSHERAKVLVNIAELYIDKNEYKKAEPVLKLAFEIYEKALGPIHSDIEEIFFNLSYIYIKQGLYSQAKQLLDSSIVIIGTIFGSNHPKVSRSLDLLCLLYRAQGDQINSMEMAKKSLQIRLNTFNSNIVALTEHEALTYSLSVKHSVNSLLSAYFDLKNPGQELNDHVADIMITSKGIVSDHIFERRRFLEGQSDSSIISLVDSLRYITHQLSQRFVEGPGREITDYQNSVDSLNDLASNLETRLCLRSEEFRNYSDAGKVNVDQIRSLVPPNSMLIDYMEYDYISPDMDSTVPKYAAVLIGNESGPIILDLGNACEIDSLVNRYRNHMMYVSTSGTAISDADMHDYHDICADLYGTIWNPVQKHLLNKDMVYIAPDGSISLISFAGLPGESGEYIIESRSIRYLSGSRDLMRMQNPGQFGRGLLAVGDPDFNAVISSKGNSKISPQYSAVGAYDDPVRNLRSACEELNNIYLTQLPGSRSEIESIVAAWELNVNEPVTVMFDADASEDRFKVDAPGTRIIHIATHGYFLNSGCRDNSPQYRHYYESDWVGENPMLLSGLFLAGANHHGRGADSIGVDDGILTAYEVSAMDLSGTSLVVLSACESGLGDIKNGEGVYGLRRAFQMAGARTVVSTLWPIMDKTSSEMLSQLYDRQGDSLSETLRKIQLRKIDELREQNKSDHPASWAAYIIIGDWR